MSEGFGADHHLDEASYGGSHHRQEPVHVLFNLSCMLWRHVTSQFWLRRGEIVGKDIRSAHQQTVLIYDHWDGPRRIYLQILALQVRTHEDIDFLVVVLGLRDVEQGKYCACVAIEVMPINFELRFRRRWRSWCNS